MSAVSYIYINTQRFTCGENLLRCGNSCSHYNYYNPIYIVKTSIQVFPGRLSRGRVFAHYPGRFFPGNSSPGDQLSTAPSPRDSEVPLNSLPRLRETPYDTRGLPCSYQRSVDISGTQKGRVSPNSLYPSD